ncbi:hypothetical protein [Streptomyces lavendulae]|uniref:hypothetical protein n=1 Tax=Streptomyces lavendulae TaxID=1914 RepID=UPI0036EEC295
MNRNQAIAVQIHADSYTIIGDTILITPRDDDARRVKAHLTPNRDGDVTMHLTAVHPITGLIDALAITYGRNAPASRFAGTVDDYIDFWFGAQPDTHPKP